MTKYDKDLGDKIAPIAEEVYHSIAAALSTWVNQKVSEGEDVNEMLGAVLTGQALAIIDVVSFIEQATGGDGSIANEAGKELIRLIKRAVAAGADLEDSD